MLLSILLGIKPECVKIGGGTDLSMRFAKPGLTKISEP